VPIDIRHTTLHREKLYSFLSINVAIGNISTVQINVTGRCEACHVLVFWDVRILSSKHYLHFV